MGASGSKKYTGLYPQDNESYVLKMYGKDSSFKCVMKNQTITATGTYVVADDKTSYDLQTNRLQTQSSQKITLVLADVGATKSTVGNGSYFTPQENLLWYGKVQSKNEAGKQEVVLRYRLPTFKMEGDRVKCDEGAWNSVSIYGKAPN